MGRDLRIDLATRPAVDVVAVVKQLVAQKGTCLRRALLGDDDWGPHEENTARLLDALYYQQEQAWIDRITDPDDQAIARERALRKAGRSRPPEDPPIRPVALRPEGVTQALLDEYVHRLTPQDQQQTPPTLDNFDAVISRL